MEQNIQQTGQISVSEPVSLLGANSSKATQGYSSYPALHPEQANTIQFKFTNPGNVHLYAVQGFYMGVVK